MFKLLLLVAVVAATPVIELQLDQAGLRKTGSTFKSERSANTQWVHHCAAKGASLRFSLLPPLRFCSWCCCITVLLLSLRYRASVHLCP